MDGYTLREFVDRTGRPYVAPITAYGAPLSREQVARRVGKKLFRATGQREYPGTLAVVQKGIITNALLQWRINGLDPKDLSREAIRIMPRQPGQWPLTEKCVVQWDNLRRRELYGKGKHWPFKTAEEFVQSGLCGDERVWNLYTDMDRIAGIQPPLGVGGSNGTAAARRVMEYSDTARNQNLRLFERDPLIYSPGKPNGTIRDRMWFEVCKMAEKVLLLHKAGWGKGDVIMATARGRLRGAVIAYAVFVDVYSYLDTPDEVITRMEKEALRVAKQSSSI